MLLNDIILNHQEMITTSIREPQDGDLAFFGKSCVAALVFKPNHWITYGSVSAGREKWPFNVLF